MSVPTIAAKYYIELFDQYCNRLKTFDHWLSLNMVQQVNGVGSHTFTIGYDDERKELFQLDGRLYVHRSVPDCRLNDYVMYKGFHRTPDIRPFPDRTWASHGVDYNHLLQRREIRYLAGTVMADKDGLAEDVMMEYVNENCGVLATVANGRLNEGTMLEFYIGASNHKGPLWQGSRSAKPLIDVITEIANKANIDWQIEHYNKYGFIFRTYDKQLGLDRTDIGMGLNPAGDKTLNAAGNVPVIFAIIRDNVAELTYILDRIAEGNSIGVWGPGEGPTQVVIVREAATVNDSPWNKLEFGRPASNQQFQYQMEDFGDDELVLAKARETFEIVPLQQARCLYGLHFTLGDRVAVIDGNIKRYKRLMKVETRVEASGTEQIEKFKFTFADIAI